MRSVGEVVSFFFTHAPSCAQDLLVLVEFTNAVLHTLNTFQSGFDYKGSGMGPDRVEP